jgi:hypothetical protein
MVAILHQAGRKKGALQGLPPQLREFPDGERNPQVG